MALANRRDAGSAGRRRAPRRGNVDVSVSAPAAHWAVTEPLWFGRWPKAWSPMSEAGRLISVIGRTRYRLPAAISPPVAEAPRGGGVLGWVEDSRRARPSSRRHGIRFGRGMTRRVQGSISCCVVVCQVSWCEQVVSGRIRRVGVVARSPSTSTRCGTPGAVGDGGQQRVQDQRLSRRACGANVANAASRAASSWT